MDFRAETGEFVLTRGEMAILDTGRSDWPTDEAKALQTVIDEAEAQIKARQAGTTGSLADMRSGRYDNLFTGMRNFIEQHSLSNDDLGRLLEG